MEHTILTSIVVALIVIPPLALIGFLIWLLIRIGKKRRGELTEDPSRPKLGLAGWLDLIIAVAVTIGFATLFTHWLMQHSSLAQKTPYIIVPLLFYVMLLCLVLGYRSIKRLEKKGLLPPPGSTDSRPPLKTLTIVLGVLFLSMAIVLIYPPPVGEWLTALHVPLPSWLVWVLPAWLLLRSLRSAKKPETDPATPPAPKSLTRTLIWCVVWIIIGTVYGQILQAPVMNQKQCDDLSNPQRLIDACTSIINAGEGKSGAYTNRGVAYNSIGSLDLALNDETTAISLDPNNAVAFSNRASIYVKQEHYDKALQDLDTALRLKPDFVIAYSLRGGVYAIEGQNDKALADYSAALKLDPGHVPAKLLRSETYVNMGLYADAIKELDQLSTAKPNFSMILETRGIAKYLGISPVSSMGDLTAAQHLDRSDASTAIWLHLAHLASGQNDEQEWKLTSSAIDTQKWPAPIVDFYLGKIPLEEVLTKAKAEDPYTQSNQLCDANYYIGKWYALSNQKDKAAPLFQAAVKVCPIPSIGNREGQAELKALGL